MAVAGVVGLPQQTTQSQVYFIIVGRNVRVPRPLVNIIVSLQDVFDAGLHRLSIKNGRFIYLGAVLDERSLA